MRSLTFALCVVATATQVQGQLCSVDARPADVLADDLADLSLLQTDLSVARKAALQSHGPLLLAEEVRDQVLEGWTFYHYSAVLLVIITAMVAGFARPKLDALEDKVAFNDLRFKSHRYRFLLVFAICVSSDWLQGPYMYGLYISYGYTKDTINQLYLIGFASSAVLGTMVGSLADKFGRKRAAILYCMLRIVACALAHCSQLYVLMVGRVASGIAMSLLESAFECWLVSDHTKRHGFSAALLRYMFSMMYSVNWLVAILSALFTHNAVSSVPMRRFSGFDTIHYGGDTCAFDASICMLCLAIPLICLTWDENYGDSEQSMLDSLTSGVRSLLSSWHMSMVGIAVACFEGAMYVFLLNWTGSLQLDEAPTLPLGVIFSCMMMCCMIGSASFTFVHPSTSSSRVALAACLSASLCLAFAAASCERVNYLSAVFFMFLFYQLCIGIYNPSAGVLKSEVVPEAARSGVYNLYKMPVKCIVIAVLLCDLSLRAILAICSCLLAFGTLVLVHLEKHPPEKQQQEAEISY